MGKTIQGETQASFRNLNLLKFNLSHFPVFYLLQFLNYFWICNFFHALFPIVMDGNSMAL